MKTRLPKRSRVIQPAIERLSTNIRNHYQDRLKYLILYGSYAKGSFNDDSDVDLLVVLDKVDSVFQEVDILTGLKFDLMLEQEKFFSTNPVSVSDYLNSNDIYFKNVKKDGVIL